MQLKLIRTIFLKELRDILRDRRTLFVMIVLPVILYPLLLVGIVQLTAIQLSRIAQRTSRVAVVGREHAGDLSSMLDTLSGIAPVDSARWQQRIEDGEIEAALVLREGFADSVARGLAPAIGLYHNSSKEVSKKAHHRLSKLLSAFADQVVAERLSALAADTSLLRPFALRDEDFATAQQRQGDLLGKFLGYLLIMMTIMGAFYPAVDLTAGEKERGTMETLLVSPASRADIVYGKFLAVVVIALITALLNLFSLGLTFLYGLQFAGGAAAHALPSLAVSPLSLVLSLLIIVPLAVLFAALCLAVAVCARNYKEGQSLLTPVYMLVILPAMVSLVPGTEMSPLLAAIPVANVSLLVKEFMTGNYPWREMLIAFGSTSLLAVAALRWATSQFEQESVLFRHAEDVRWSPFARRRGPLVSPYPRAGTVLTVIALEILLLFYVGTRPAEWTIQRSLLVSQLAIVLLPLVVLRRGGYDHRRVLAFRIPPPAAWPATLVLIAGGWLLAIELASLQHMLTPFPEEFLQRFEQFFATLNALPLPMTLVLIGALPGVCEEILCRGFVLRSLVPRLGITGAVILSAVAFGLLHLDPYRLLATTFLGLLLGIIAVWSGSIYPAMLAHAANNIGSLLVQRYQQQLLSVPWLHLESARLLPWHVVAVAALLLVAGALWLRKIGGRPASSDSLHADGDDAVVR